MPNKKKSAYKIQSSVEAYTSFVLNGLIEIKGTSISDVVSYILKSWIDQNAGLLDEMNLSVRAWKDSLKK